MVDPDRGRLWGAQYPFERNHLQRMMTLIGMGGLFAVTVILLAHADIVDVFGITLMCAGALSAGAAFSRRRYEQETRLGFAILAVRGGRFVRVSALAFALVAVWVALLIVLD